ncbi:alkane 1-monooxygenase [Roseovarius sp. 22II1-1F6A]|nr:alkane 1-monooxygenase [Roseovarius sp. 22II1-1F6A]
MTLPYSVLDLSPVPEGSTVAQALANTVDLARHAEDWGYNRFWLAEHHNMTGIASAATAVLIGQVAAHTSKIRVGAGGIMLPNHAPLMVAEAFGTLAEMYPDRIDLGLGRAPGTDMPTFRALRRGLSNSGDTFPQDVEELLGYFAAVTGRPPNVRAVPGEGTQVPVWILGSSLFGAQLAAMLGLPYAFASHFAPAALEEAAYVYRRNFQPSEHLDKPHFMMAMNIFAADDEDEAVVLRSSMLQAFANLRLGRPGPLPKPLAPGATLNVPAQVLEGAAHALSVTAVGTPATLRDRIQALVAPLAPDEVIVTGQIHDHAARLRSFEIAAQALQGIDLARAA